MIIRRNPLFRIITGTELVAKNTSLQSEVSTPNTFFLIYNNNFSKENIISIDIQTANYLYSVSKPTRASETIDRINNLSPTLLIKSLVYDHIIQVKNRNGKYESGPSCRLIKDSLEKCFDTTASCHRIGILSQNAIKYAWHFRDLSIDEITQKLYSFYTMPVEKTLFNCLKSTDNIKAWLGLGEFSKMLDEYIQTPITDNYKHWLYWQHEKTKNTYNLNFKMYISPTPLETVDVFSKVLKLFTRQFVPSFKIGATSNGIYRPDKMVLYFSDINSIYEFAHMCAPLLKDNDGQGVPFTFPLTENGIISYACEPTEGYSSSWRIYICKIIAKTIKLQSFRDNNLFIHSIINKLNILGIETNKWNRVNYK